GADVLARSQTGTGKTVAFGIPAVERISPDEPSVQVLVLSPTRELAHQCGEEIRKLARHLPHVRTADILGGGDYRNQFRELRSANLVIGTPGRIMDHLCRGTLDLTHLKMVILDEADEMLNMGFREDIEVILKDVPAQRQIVLFSATIPNEILTIADQFQKEPVHIDVNHNQITLKDTKQVYVEVPLHQKAEALTLLLHYYHPNRAIIFSNTKTMVDELTEKLSASGFSAEGLHGDMKQLQRTTVMNGFRKGRVSILVATDVAARGIDVSDIDYVVNFDIPKEADSYVHRIGRTGRAGHAGNAVTLCCGRQQVVQLQRICQRTKSNISLIPLPTVADIEQANHDRMLQFIENLVQSEPAPFCAEMVEQLVQKGYAPEKIAAALLGLYAHNDTKKLTDLPGASSGTGKARKIRDCRAMSNVVINIGLANRVTEKHIIGAVTERAGISSHDIGQVEISESLSTVGVPTELVDDVIASMNGCKIRGKLVSATPLIEYPSHTKKRTFHAAPVRRTGRPAAKRSDLKKGGTRKAGS
ncbi:MAG: DEAD/DEAH box helicase, partial [Lawsonibacter sp.]|nr:DEAD/DEAH box helicase [Lawsonibacter sp.]